MKEQYFLYQNNDNDKIKITKIMYQNPKPKEQYFVYHMSNLPFKYWLQYIKKQATKMD